MITPLPIDAPNRRNNLTLTEFTGKYDELKIIAFTIYHDTQTSFPRPDLYQELLYADKFILLSNFNI